MPGFRLAGICPLKRGKIPRTIRNATFDHTPSKGVPRLHLPQYAKARLPSFRSNCRQERLPGCRRPDRRHSMDRSPAGYDNRNRQVQCRRPEYRAGPLFVSNLLVYPCRIVKRGIAARRRPARVSPAAPPWPPPRRRNPFSGLNPRPGRTNRRPGPCGTKALEPRRARCRARRMNCPGGDPAAAGAASAPQRKETAKNLAKAFDTAPGRHI